mmetsp:Transcript_20548/g.35066  ORF Transcript_20548/g.35066 Transcript_20548/m.35066 type:complete len:324 (-) Transcript_20548:38-1009(-)
MARKKSKPRSASSAAVVTYPKPPYSLRINPLTKQVDLKCTLHKIPPKCIDFDPTRNRLRLNTLAYSKKYYLDVPYPEGVIVDAGENSEAKFENGVLSACFDIIENMPEYLLQSSEVLGKRKQTETIDEPPKKKKKLNTGDESLSKPKKILSSDNENTKKPKKSFVTKKTALDLIDEVNDVVDKNVKGKKEKEKSKMEWMAEREAVREKRKQAKKDKKKEERKEIVQQIQESKKQNKKPKNKKQESTIELPKPKVDENGLKSILKEKDTPKKKARVSFSPNLVQVKAIPRVKSQPNFMSFTAPIPRRNRKTKKAKLLGVSKRIR